MAGNMVLGFVCCLVAGLGFGSNYLPCKKVAVGDGIFFSACMAIGILLVGIIVNFTVAEGDYALWPPHRPPKFEIAAAVGGAFWMLGNFCCPLIVRCLGLGLGLAIWDCFNLLTGWATGNLGLFGVWREEVASPMLNYIGVAMALVSLVLLSFATDEEQPEAEAATQDLKATAQVSAGPGESDLRDLEQPRDSTEDEAAEQTGAESIDESEEQVCKVTSQEPMKHIATTASMASTEAIATTVSMASTESSCGTDHDEEEKEEEEEEEEEAAADLERGCSGLDKPKPDTLDTLSKITECPSPSNLPPLTKTATRAAAASQCLSAMLASLRGLSCKQRQFACGFLLAIVAGFLFGLTFDLPTDLMQLGKLGEDHSTDPMDYVFSHFCGIAITAATVLAVYMAVKRETSYMPRNAFFPATASGAIWAVAQVAWFQANVELSMSVAFPIISTLPGIVGMLWGYFLFGEFRSARSRRMAVAGMALRIPAVVLIALSAI